MRLIHEKHDDASDTMMAERTWSTREEWVAQAARDGEFYFYECGRKPSSAPKEYLSAEELAAAERLAAQLVRDLRRRCTQEIRRLRVLVGPRPTRRTDRVRWCLALDPQHPALRLGALEDARRALGRSWRTRPLFSSCDSIQRQLTTAARDLDLDGTDVPELAALDTLATQYESRYAAARDRALQAAIAAEVARRQTDAAWDTELKRRAWIDTPVDPSTCVHRVALRRATARQEREPGQEG